MTIAIYLRNVSGFIVAPLAMCLGARETARRKTQRSLLLIGRIHLPHAGEIIHLETVILHAHTHLNVVPTADRRSSRASLRCCSDNDSGRTIKQKKCTAVVMLMRNEHTEDGGKQ